MIKEKITSATGYWCLEQPSTRSNISKIKDFEIAIDKHWENQEMKYNHNANIKLKTGRKRSYTTIQRDDDKIEADKVVDDQRP